MLYILFGKDKIGKNTVRSIISKTYGINIIPKYTDDIERNWSVIDYKGFVSKRTFVLPQDTDDLNKTREHLRQKDIKCYTCDENDPYLRLFAAIPDAEIKEEYYDYKIVKSNQNTTYAAHYYIKKAHIEKAATDIYNDYLLVCASGNVIKKIWKLFDQLRRMKSFSTISSVKVVLLEGETLKDEPNSRKATWKVIPTIKDDMEHDLPAAFLLENSQRFAGTIRTERCVTEDNTLDYDRLSKIVCRQWEQITGMLPLRPKAFIVRPFSGKSANGNVNDMIAKKLGQLLMEWSDDTIDIVQLKGYQQNSVASIFDSMERALTESQIVIVDLRKHRRNCYYEYGFAMGLCKSSSCVKHIYCLLGAAIDSEEDVTTLSEEAKENMLGELLDEMQRNKAYDTTLFPHYKYVAKTVYDADGNPDVRIEFIQSTDQDNNFKQDIETLMKPIIERSKKTFY